MSDCTSLSLTNTFCLSLLLTETLKHFHYFFWKLHNLALCKRRRWKKMRQWIRKLKACLPDNHLPDRQTSYLVWCNISTIVYRFKFKCWWSIIEYNKRMITSEVLFYIRFKLYWNWFQLDSILYVIDHTIFYFHRSK